MMAEDDRSGGSVRKLSEDGSSTYYNRVFGRWVGGRSCLCPTDTERNQSEPLRFRSESDRKFWNTVPPK